MTSPPQLGKTLSDTVTNWVLQQKRWMSVEEMCPLL